jgi:hypothetical protein
VLDVAALRRRRTPGHTDRWRRRRRVPDQPRRRSGLDRVPHGLGSKLSDALEATEVAFEADNAALRLDEQARRGDDPWSVVVHGSAELITRQTDLFDSFELPVRPWHVSDKPYFVRLVPTNVSGRRFRLDPTP